MSQMSDMIRNYVVLCPYDLYQFPHWKLTVRDGWINSIDFGYTRLNETRHLNNGDNEAFYEQNRDFIQNVLEPLMMRYPKFTTELSVDGDGNLLFGDHDFIGRFEFKYSDSFTDQIIKVLEEYPELFQKNCKLTFISSKNRSRILSYTISQKDLFKNRKKLKSDTFHHNVALLEHIVTLSENRDYFETELKVNDQGRIDNISVKVIFHRSDFEKIDS